MGMLVRIARVRGILEEVIMAVWMDSERRVGRADNMGLVVLGEDKVGWILLDLVSGTQYTFPRANENTQLGEANSAQVFCAMKETERN